MQKRTQKVSHIIDKAFALTFVFGLFTAAICTYWYFLPDVKQSVTLSPLNKEMIAQIESVFNADIVHRKHWINIYGGAQRVFLKNEVNDFEVIKDKNGFLHIPAEKIENDVLSEYANNLQYFYDLCRNKNIPFLYIAAPAEVMEDKTVMPSGISDFGNVNIDRFLRMLEDREIPYLDTRPLLDEMPLEDIFYRTDHHWALPASIKTLTETIRILNEDYNMELDSEFILQNTENYICKVYENSFLGSRGIKVGELYAGKDTFRVLVPKFETNLENRYFVNSELMWTKTGSFWDTMIDEDILNDTSYYNKYNVFMFASSCENRIVNHNADNDYRILVISDSFGRQLVPYLSLYVKQTRWLDPQPGRYSESYTDYIEEYNPDCVIVMFNGQSTYITIPQ